MKKRALRDPEKFATALKEGQIGMRIDESFHPTGEDSNEDEYMTEADGVA